MMGMDRQETLLAEGMRRATAGITPPEGLARRAWQRHRRRRRWRARAAATGTVAALTAAAMVTWGVVAGYGPAAPAPQRPGEAVTTGYVVRHVMAALSPAGAGHLVQYTRAVSLNRAGRTLSATVSWAYGGSSRTRALSGAGRLIADTGWRVSGQQVVITVVDYPTRSWFRSAAGARQVTKAPPGSAQAGGCAGYVTSPVPATAVYTPAFIRWGLRCGVFVVAGRQRIDGAPTIRLVRAGPGRRGGFGELWVSPVTFLPVRVVWDVAGASLPGDLALPSERSVRIDFAWLPATAANLARLRVPIPAGFRRRASPVGAALVTGP